MLWDAVTGERIASVPAHHADAIAATFSADGLTIATVGEDGAGRLWHTATLQPLLELALPGDTYGDRVELAADQSRLLVHTRDDQIVVYDTIAPQKPQ
jgi:WD40 repeat protein